jgi:hypothetical protein
MHKGNKNLWKESLTEKNNLSYNNKDINERMNRENSLNHLPFIELSNNL